MERSRLVSSLRAKVCYYKCYSQSGYGFFAGTMRPASSGARACRSLLPADPIHLICHSSAPNETISAPRNDKNNAFLARGRVIVRRRQGPLRAATRVPTDFAKRDFSGKSDGESRPDAAKSTWQILWSRSPIRARTSPMPQQRSPSARRDGGLAAPFFMLPARFSPA